MAFPNRQFIIFDTECSGLTIKSEVETDSPDSIMNKGSEVCQIGGIVHDEKMVPSKLFCYYCDILMPECSEGAVAVHGIDMREVRKYIANQYLPEVMTTYLPEFFGQDVIFVGYNSEFDMAMVRQNLVNSPLRFEWTPCKKSILPKRGRYSVDVAEFVRGSTYYRKLSSFEAELKPKRGAFLSQYSYMSIETNCIDLLQRDWEKAHNSFFDALNTYLLWEGRVWKKKLV